MEYYPFTNFDLEDFENILDFKIISKNQYIDWDYKMVEKYKDSWDWFQIEENPIICKEVNLGLLYPDKVSIERPLCSCYKELGYCDMPKFCKGEYDKIKMSRAKTGYLNPILKRFIKTSIQNKQLDNEVLSLILLYNLDIEIGVNEEIKDSNQIEDSKEDYEDLPFWKFNSWLISTSKATLILKRV